MLTVSVLMAHLAVLCMALRLPLHCFIVVLRVFF